MIEHVMDYIAMNEAAALQLAGIGRVAEAVAFQDEASSAREALLAGVFG